MLRNTLPAELITVNILTLRSGTGSSNRPGGYSVAGLGICRKWCSSGVPGTPHYGPPASLCLEACYMMSPALWNRLHKFPHHLPAKRLNMLYNYWLLLGSHMPPPLGAPSLSPAPGWVNGVSSVLPQLSVLIFIPALTLPFCVCVHTYPTDWVSWGPSQSCLFLFLLTVAARLPLINF